METNGQIFSSSHYLLIWAFDQKIHLNVFCCCQESNKTHSLKVEKQQQQQPTTTVKACEGKKAFISMLPFLSPLHRKSNCKCKSRLLCSICLISIWKWENPPETGSNESLEARRVMDSHSWHEVKALPRLHYSKRGKHKECRRNTHTAMNTTLIMMSFRLFLLVSTLIFVR